MATQYTYRIAITVPAAGKAAINTTLATHGWGSNNFPLGLVPAGGADDAAVTRWLSFWQMAAGQRTIFLNFCANNPSVKYIGLNEATREVVGGNVTGWEALEGQIFTLDALLAEFGLKRRVEEAVE
jgi:hypothetical protein